MRARLLACAALLALPLPAGAVTCSASAQLLSFGNYDPFAALPNDSTGRVSVTCSNLLSLLLTYTVSLSQGLSNSYASRQMASGSYRLGYNLYTDVTRLSVWGDGFGGTSTVTNTFLVVIGGITANHTVYGRIPALQSPAVGSYSDTITATVNY